MAARRAAARAAAAAAAEPPPPPAEPIPEPEPEVKEPEPEKPPAPEDNLAKTNSKESISREGKVTERIIERIIICPGGQPYMSQPPPQPPQPCLCAGQQGGKKKRKGKKKRMDEDDGLCSHPYCIVQRARTKPQGLPWASGLYPGQGCQPAPQQPQGRPPVVICQRPIICYCRKREDSDDSDDEDDDPARTDTETYMTFMNMVFAASNVMNERRDDF